MKVTNPPRSTARYLSLAITLLLFTASSVRADHTPDPTSVTIAGTFQEELANLRLTLDYGEDGGQVVEDKVLNWRNVEPCGD